MNSNTINQASVITVLDDPASRTTPLLSSWRVVDRFQIGQWTGNKAITCSSAVLRDGDFVNVRISFDIFVLPLRRWTSHLAAKHFIRTHLNIEHVLQLCPAEAAAEASWHHHHPLSLNVLFLHQFIRKEATALQVMPLPSVTFGKTALTFWICHSTRC